MNGELPNPEETGRWYGLGKDEGVYRGNTSQKLRLAIGRDSLGSGIDTNGDTVLYYDPPLTEEEQKKIENVFNSESRPADPPKKDAGQEFVISDIWDSDFREALGKKFDCEVTVWFDKSDPSLRRTDRIKLQFSKQLTEEDRAKISEAIRELLLLGWSK